MIVVADFREFAKLISALSDDVVHAHIHWRLHCDLVEAIKKQPEVFYQSRTFWHLTIDAHEVTAVENLCRAFDQEQSSLHLLSWLRTIQDNLHLFSLTAFKERLSGNAFVDSLAESFEPPDASCLEADILECTSTDPLVRKLIVHRSATVAHRSAKRVVKGNTLPQSLAISVEDIEELLARARKLLNRYSQLFSAEVHSVNMIGRDDYEYVFKAVAKAVARWDSATEA